MNTPNALERLLRLAENLTPSGVIGDGMVAEFHSLAKQVRAQEIEDSGNSSNLCVAIGEHAFRAGFKAAETAWRQAHDPFAENNAWDAYDPPEEFKGLAL